MVFQKDAPANPPSPSPGRTSRLRGACSAFYRWCSPHVSTAWDSYRRHFLGGFCYYILLLLLLLFPLVLLLGLFGAKFGPQLLFLHEDWLKQAFAGVSLTLFLVAVFFVGYMLWLRDIRHGRLEPDYEEWLQSQATIIQQAGYTPPPVPIHYRKYFPAVVLAVIVTVLGLLVLLEVGAPLLRVLSGPGEDSPRSPHDGKGLGAYLFLLGGMLLALLLLHFVGRHLHALGDFLFGKLTEWRVGRVRNLLGWVAGPLLVVGWGAAFLLHLLQGTPSFAVKAWTLALALIGLAVTFTAVLRGWRSKGVPRLLFHGVWVANLILIYVFSTWCHSHSPLGLLVALPVGLLCSYLLVLALSTYCGEQWQRQGESWYKSLDHLHKEERRYLALALGGGVVLAGLLLLFALCGPLASPVTLLMFFLFVLLVVYGLAAYFVRRKLIVGLILVVFLAFVSHIQRYRMRFPGLDYYSEADIRDLVDDVKNDVGRQNEFDNHVEKYSQNKKLLDDTEADLDNLQRRMAEVTTPEEKKALLDEEIAKQSEKMRYEKTQRELTAGLRAAWNEMEQNNRVLPGRFPIWLKREYPRLATHLQEVDSDRLLRTRQLKHTPESKKEQRPLVIISVSGGGIRAAYWTFLILKRLELELAD